MDWRGLKFWVGCGASGATRAGVVRMVGDYRVACGAYRVYFGWLSGCIPGVLRVY